MQQAREVLENYLKQLDFDVEVIETPGKPIILAERKAKPTDPKLIIYGHYDVQPPDPLNLWKSEPFEPTVRGDRIYGRGAADNKGPISVYLAAVSEVLSEQPELPLNITFVLEGEEEIGSPSFTPVIEQHKDRLKGDFVLACDTGSHKADQLVVTTGLRGIACFEVRLKGPDSDLHSGVYGGSILNPIHALTDICASLHNPDGTINVPGFYDDIIEAESWEREELAKLGISEEEYIQFLGVPGLFRQPGITPFEAIRVAPTLEFNGIGGGYQGEGSKTVIPSEAFVKISCRLVANQDAVRIQNLVMDTIRERCPKEVTLDFIVEHHGNPYMVVPPGKSNTPEDQNPVLARAFAATEKLAVKYFGKDPQYLREGGSIPIIGDIKKVLGMDSLMLGLYLPEDAMHAPNESFDLGMMRKGQSMIQELLVEICQ